MGAGVPSRGATSGVASRTSVMPPTYGGGYDDRCSRVGASVWTNCRGEACRGSFSARISQREMGPPQWCSGHVSCAGGAAFSAAPQAPPATRVNPFPGGTPHVRQRQPIVNPAEATTPAESSAYSTSYPTSPATDPAPSFVNPAPAAVPADAPTAPAGRLRRARRRRQPCDVPAPAIPQQPTYEVPAAQPTVAYPAMPGAAPAGPVPPAPAYAPGYAAQVSAPAGYPAQVSAPAGYPAQVSAPAGYPARYRLRRVTRPRFRLPRVTRPRFRLRPVTRPRFGYRGLSGGAGLPGGRSSAPARKKGRAGIIIVSILTVLFLLTTVAMSGLFVRASSDLDKQKKTTASQTTQISDLNKQVDRHQGPAEHACRTSTSGQIDRPEEGAARSPRPASTTSTR